MYTKKELYALASKYDIVGRSSMTKEDLFAAVQPHVAQLVVKPATATHSPFKQRKLLYDRLEKQYATLRDASEKLDRTSLMKKLKHELKELKGALDPSAFKLPIPTYFWAGNKEFESIFTYKSTSKNQHTLDYDGARDFGKLANGRLDKTIEKIKRTQSLVTSLASQHATMGTKVKQEYDAMMALVKEVEDGIAIDKQMIHSFNTNQQLIQHFKHWTTYSSYTNDTLWNIAESHSSDWSRFYDFIYNCYKFLDQHKLI